MSGPRVEVRVVTDPACAWSWASEPKLRRLLGELGPELEPRWIMGGMASTIDADGSWRYAEIWPNAAAESGMPFDPRIWTNGAISSTYPACRAVVAAGEQGSEAASRYLRRLREGLMHERRRLDGAEALIAEAAAAGLDVEPFE